MQSYLQAVRVRYARLRDQSRPEMKIVSEVSSTGRIDFLTIRTFPLASSKMLDLDSEKVHLFQCKALTETETSTYGLRSLCIMLKLV